MKAAVKAAVLMVMLWACGEAKRDLYAPCTSSSECVTNLVCTLGKCSYDLRLIPLAPTGPTGITGGSCGKTSSMCLDSDACCSGYYCSASASRCYSGCRDKSDSCTKDSDCCSSDCGSSGYCK